MNTTLCEGVEGWVHLFTGFMGNKYQNNWVQSRRAGLGGVQRAEVDGVCQKRKKSRVQEYLERNKVGEKLGGLQLFLFRSSILGLLRKVAGGLERWLKS